jgi:hypothetical protein
MAENEGIGDILAEWLKNLRTTYEEDTTGVPTMSEEGKLAHPTDETMINKGVEKLVRQRQDEKAEELGKRNPHLLEVNLQIENPYTLLESTEGLLYQLREELLEEIEKRDIFEMKNPALEKNEDEMFTYLIEKQAGEDRPATIIGGADPIFSNIAENLDWTEDEKDLVRLVHEAAAEKNGYDRHTLVGDVLLIPVYISSPDKKYLT